MASEVRRLAIRALNRARRVAFPIHKWLERRVMPAPAPPIRLGTAYGGWWVVPPLQQGPQRKAILCGAGEDLSFDLALQAEFDLTCIIVDPTPRAVAHFEGLMSAMGRGEPFPLGGSPTGYYETAGVDGQKLVYVAAAVWDSPGEIKFFKPKNPAHVSHSAVDSQHTGEFISVPALTLEEIAGVLDCVELVKFDIEGAAPTIIRWMLRNSYLPPQILVEFEEALAPTGQLFDTVKSIVSELEERGYDLVHFDGQANCTFFRRTELSSKLAGNNL